MGSFDRESNKKLDEAELKFRRVKIKGLLFTLHILCLP